MAVCGARVQQEEGGEKEPDWTQGEIGAYIFTHSRDHTAASTNGISCVRTDVWHVLAGVGPSNKLLCRSPPTWKSDSPMTRGQLLSKRDEFWDTAPAFNGRPEIWQALRVSAEAEDQETAQAVASAVNVTLPLGNLSMVYDELGNKYEVGRTDRVARTHKCQA